MENYGSYGSREIDLVIDMMPSHKGKVLRGMWHFKNRALRTTLRYAHVSDKTKREKYKQCFTL